MDMQFSFEVNRQTRKNILRTLEGLSEEQINIIPEGFKNNIAWNLGHILITHQLLYYSMCGLPAHVPEDWIEKYRKGSRPEDKITMEEFDMLKEMFVTSVDKAEEDFNKGRFSEYNAYKTSYGVDINSIEDVIGFIFAHDAFHWGVMAAMRKLVEKD